MRTSILRLLPFLAAPVLLAGARSASPPSPAAPDSARAAVADSLFSALRGGWSCEGAFADGRPLAADLTFEPAPGARTLHFRHADRAPNSYLQDATWGLDAAGERVVSLAFAGTGRGPAAPALFVARSWTARTITLAADTLAGSPPFAPNRFTYALVAPDSLTMVWEVGRGGTWRMGDRLGCARR